MHDGRPAESARAPFRCFRPSANGPKLEAPMATLHFRSKIPHVPPRALALGLTLGLALAAGAGRAGDRAPAPARPAGGGTDRPCAKVAFAGANRDTLPYDWRDVYPVAVEQLADADWTIQRADTAS